MRDCAAGQACVAGLCQESEASGSCTLDADCPESQTCDVTLGVCEMVPVPVMGCTDDSECGSSEKCDLDTNRCIEIMSNPDCTTTADCDPGLQCRLDTGICVECLTPEHCSNGECIDNICKSTEPDPQCTLDAECDPPNTICEARQCVNGCNSGLVCDENSVCDSTTGRCVSVAGPCQADAECAPPMTVCEASQCVPGCAEFGGIQCTGNTSCETASGRCVASNMDICRTDSDCNSPQTICDLVNEVCVPGCGSTGCMSPLMCNVTTGHCASTMVCTDDAREPNDSAGQATAIVLGSGIDLQACPNNEDFYSFNLVQGEVLRIDLAFRHGDGDINAALISGGTVVANAQSTSDNESLVYTAVSTGLHQLRVFLQTDSGPNPGNAYRLSSSTMMAACGVDIFEENDERDSAVFVTPDTYLGLNVCPGDDDYYRILMNAGDQFTVRANFSHAEGDIDIRLLNVLGLPVGGSNSTTDNEEASYSATRIGTVIVEVSLYSDSGSIPGNAYTLEIIRR